MLKNKKSAKIVSLVIVAAFIIGIVGVGLTQLGNTTQAAPSNNIAKVDYNRLIAEHPQSSVADQKFKEVYEQAQKDFNTKSANMSDQEKQNYYRQTQERLAGEQQRLLKPIIDQINAAIKSVADAKGFAAVFDGSQVVYGGTDITDDVLKKLK